MIPDKKDVNYKNLRSYNGNPNLKRERVEIEWTPEMVQEYLRCSKDPIYFAETYMKIIHVDRGLVPFELYDYQKKMITTMANERKTILATARQSGKSVTTCAFILWYILFHKDKTVAMLANKGETAREILGRIQLAYQHLPKWLQHGVVEWNKGSFELENNSRVIAAATSSDSIRGYSINCVGGSTLITVKDKETGFISRLSMDELEWELKHRPMSYGFVYLTTNKVNGKKYIGMHRAKEQDGYLGSGKLLRRAIEKYGIENFEQKILAFADSEQELCLLETHYLYEHNAAEDPNYYNILDASGPPLLFGPDNGFYGKSHDAKAKEKMSATHKGKFISEEHKISAAEKLKKLWEDPNFRERMSKRKPRRKFTEEEKVTVSNRHKGKKLSDETKKKIRLACEERWSKEESHDRHREAMKTRNNEAYKTEEFKEQARLRRVAWNKSDEKKALNRKNQLGKSRKKKVEYADCNTKQLL